MCILAHNFHCSVRLCQFTKSTESSIPAYYTNSHFAMVHYTQKRNYGRFLCFSLFFIDEDGTIRKRFPGKIFVTKLFMTSLIELQDKRVGSFD